MNERKVPVGNAGRHIMVAELGDGPPVLYLHDFLDIHGATPEWLPFHERLAERVRLIAPAFAGCNGSDEDEAALSFDDTVFDVLDVIDALDLESVPIIGVGIGGWIAAELAVRAPRLVERLVLVGATGLFVPKSPIADVFYHVQPINGGDMSDFRRLFFAEPESALALEWAPNHRLPGELELMRYAMFRFASRIGFKPPYLYDRRLTERLPRYPNPALVLWGSEDTFVPPSHARAYAQGLPAAHLRILEATGHALHIERPTEAADEITTFLSLVVNE